MEALKDRPETKRRIDSAEESHDAKLARFFEQQDRARGDDGATAGGAASGIGGQTVAVVGGPPAELTLARLPRAVAGKLLRHEAASHTRGGAGMDQRSR